MRTVVVPVLLLAASLSACGDANSTAAPVSDETSPTASPASTAAPASPSPAPPTAAPSAAASGRTVVYWLGATDDRRGPRLYREFLNAPSAGDPVATAVERMLGEPLDADYDSLWADGTTLRGVERDGTTAVVDLSREATRNGGGSAFEQRTLQQLVHTVTAADPAVKAVRLHVEGEPVETLWGAADASKPLTRAPAAETLGPVWLDVADGATIDGAFGGTASVFEATVSWELRAGDRVVDEGFDTASAGAPSRGDWSAETDAPPGDYVLRAYESSAEDGSVTWLDTKRVRISR